MFKVKHINRILFIIAIAISGYVLSSCNDDEENADNSIRLDSFGPSPVLHGGELIFIGNRLNEVTEIILPGDLTISSFELQTEKEIRIIVPEEATEGVVVLKTSQGEITTKTQLGISRPISISSFNSPAKPGTNLTIKGAYLDLVTSVILSKSVTIEKEDFESQSAEELVIPIPTNSQTGLFQLVSVQEGATDPVVVESETELVVTLPESTGVEPRTVKAGTTLTITGTDLDLVEALIFNLDSRVEAGDFVSHSETAIEVTVPDDARDGEIVLVPASPVLSSVTDPITMVLPEIGSFAPNPASLNTDVTITGKDLDLVTSIIFSGEAEGTIKSKSETEIVVTVPETAVEGPMTLNTASTKTVLSNDVNLVSPTILSTGGITPLSVNTKDVPTITINGTGLDNIASAVFKGGWEADVTMISPTQLTIDVTPGSLTGPVTLIATNGEEIVSSETLTINPDVPDITTSPATVTIGSMLVFEGTNLNVTADVYFPGDILATRFGEKSSTKLEVYVPEAVSPSVGPVKFVTDKNEVYNSPDVEFKLPGYPILDYYIYQDGLVNGWEAWGGWGHVSQDYANDQNPGDGETAIKSVFDDAYGAVQIHNSGATNIFDGYNYLVFYVYVAGEDSDIIVQIDNNSDYYPTGFTGNKYHQIVVPLADLPGAGSVSELRFKNNNADAPTNNTTVYIDEIGLTIDEPAPLE